MSRSASDSAAGVGALPNLALTASEVGDATVNGLEVWGSYGGALVIKSYYVPSGYAAVIATDGPNGSANPVGFRQHVNPDYQGLRHIPGSGPYPIVESFFARGFSVGVRHRSAAAICQIKSSGGYTAPTPIPI
jgi:hypothetical protein